MITDEKINKMQKEKKALLLKIEKDTSDEIKAELKRLNERIRYRTNQISEGKIEPAPIIKIGKKISKKIQILEMLSKNIPIDEIVKKLNTTKNSIAWYKCKNKVKA
jgi:hypothetical protein